MTSSFASGAPCGDDCRSVSEGMSASEKNRPLFSYTPSAVAMMGVGVSLKLLNLIYDSKDKKNLSYLLTHGIQINETFISLYELVEHLRFRRYAQYLNLIDSFNSLAQEKNLAMIFVTATLKSSRFNQEDVSIVKKQSALLRNFHRALRDDNLFREPTETRKKALRISQDWYYISSDFFQYIYTLEFQKDYTLHSHCAYYVPDEKLAFLNFFEVIERKKAHFSEIGRTEVVIPKKYYEPYLKQFPFKPFDNRKPDCYALENFNISSGDFLYIKFIHDETKYQNDYYMQVMRYISKYVMKGAGIKSDGSGNERERTEERLIKFNNLRMITYSKTLAPFFVFSRFYKELKERNITLYELTKMIESGRADYEVYRKDDKSPLNLTLIVDDDCFEWSSGKYSVIEQGEMSHESK
ncbi:hypothetical protein EP073_01020 [Geovibrio thiophilus]|uniref:Uncharacterized protein n=1 Tax=Geovibrio thiophilus TaxID=139438 RepID=A0A3R5Y593_9BACT|nr:hypothetical protein [Geovibrio thiophilus]QAR32031.1 hypothetical protein EP073_01020 [Geovibrio thiophilus]